jgi:hypothetical protein
MVPDFSQKKKWFHIDQRSENLNETLMVMKCSHPSHAQRFRMNVSFADSY